MLAGQQPIIKKKVRTCKEKRKVAKTDLGSMAMIGNKKIIWEKKKDSVEDFKKKTNFSRPQRNEPRLSTMFKKTKISLPGS